VIDNGEGGYSIVWQDDTGNNGDLDWIYVDMPTSVGDLDGDGSNEILLGGEGFVHAELFAVVFIYTQ